MRDMEDGYLVAAARNDAEAIRGAAEDAMRSSKPFVWLLPTHPFTALVERAYEEMDPPRTLPRPNRKGAVKLPAAMLFCLASELLGVSDAEIDAALARADELRQDEAEERAQQREEDPNIERVMRLCPPDVLTQVRAQMPQLRAKVEVAITEEGEGGFVTFPVTHPVAALLQAKLEVDSKSRLVVSPAADGSPCVRIPCDVLVSLLDMLDEQAAMDVEQQQQQQQAKKAEDVSEAANEDADALL